MKAAIFKIDGRHCDCCARTSEAIVSNEPGTISFKTKVTRILFDPEAFSEDKFTASIRKAGYTVASRSS